MGIDLEEEERMRKGKKVKGENVRTNFVTFFDGVTNDTGEMTDIKA